MFAKILKTIALLTLASTLASCDMVVMNPSGDIAKQQSELIIYSTILMLIVIVPVMALTVFFAYKYRASNKSASYAPDWDHSISLEIVIWSVPLAIIICLAGLTWVATHRLEPYNPIRRISENKPVPADVKPLVIRAVALDWKWLFIYPEQGIATVNEVAAVVDRPIEFQLTSTSVMNSMYIPALAGQIYAMPGMQTKLNAVINKAGSYQGFSANYSGEGFSRMRFRFRGLPQSKFDEWIQKASSGKDLDHEELIKLKKPTIGHRVTFYSSVERGLWERTVNLCIGKNDLCRHDLMVVDALGGGGLKGIWKRELYKGICAVDDPSMIMSLVRPEQQRLENRILSALSKKSASSLVSNQLKRLNRE